VNDFSPETQDLIAVESIRQIHAIDDVISGDLSTATSKASATWAALPNGPSLPNAALQPYMHYDKFVEAFREAGGTAK
jgi:muramidase (phage lysozyme)